MRKFSNGPRERPSALLGWSWACFLATCASPCLAIDYDTTLISVFRSQLSHMILLHCCNNEMICIADAGLFVERIMI